MDLTTNTYHVKMATLITLMDVVTLVKLRVDGFVVKVEFQMRTPSTLASIITLLIIRWDLKLIEMDNTLL